MNCLLTCDFHVVQIRFIDKILIACQHVIFCFVFFFNSFITISCMWNSLWLTLFSTDSHMIIQQQQQQQQQLCKCYMSLFLRSNSTQGFCFVSMCFYCCSRWCKFCSFSWCTTAAHLCSLFLDHCHSCFLWSQCFLCTKMNFKTTGSVSSIIVHKCNSYSEKWCVDFWQLYRLSEIQYDALFRMSSYIKAF